MDQEKIIKRANTAYLRSGGNYAISTSLCTVETVEGEMYVVLRNSYQILAVYRYRKDSLMRVTEWPALIS